MSTPEKEPIPVEPKVVKIRRWVFEEKTFDDGKVRLTRTNDGFGALELLGLANLAKDEIWDTMKGDPPHFDHIKRQIITE